MKNDVITFGSATKDLFLRSDATVLENERFTSGKGICFPLGSKVSVDDIFFSIGGGGTNTAVTFARQGLKVSYMGKVGKDLAGKDVIDTLQSSGVGTDMIITTKQKRTNFSVVLDIENKDRTILVYRGASGTLKPQEIPANLRADWFYLAPFSRSAIDAFYRIVEKGKNEDVKLAVNPSKSQLRDEKFLEMINSFDVLIVNREEASIFTDIPYEKESLIFQKMDKLFEGIFIMTKGSDGLIASDNRKIYKVSETPEVKVVDRTGAGDSFGSGFLAGIIKGMDIKKAIELGVANATGCLSEKGAKNGLLKKDDDYQPTVVEISEI